MQASRVISEPRKLRSATAFTLVELLVSMTVLSIIVVMLASLLNVSLRTWGTVESDSERHRSGRALTDFIGRELRQAMIPVGSMVTAGTPAPATNTVTNLQFLIDPRDSVSSNDYYNADAIFWQAPLATENTYGDIAEVGYFVKWITNGSTNTPTLCRFFVNPSTVDSSGAVGQNSNFQIYTNQVWLTPDLLAKVAPADNQIGPAGTKNGYAGLFAENVIGFWVRSYGIDNSELSPNHTEFDSRKGYPLKMGAGATAVGRQQYLPALVKISIAQVDSKYGARLTAAKSTIRPLVNAAVDATAFQSAAQSAASQSVVMRTLLPGIRIYSTDVYLDNAK